MLAVGPMVSPETGQYPVPLTITNVGGGACALDGYPIVTFRDSEGAIIPFTFRHGDQEVTAQPPQNVVIPPGHAAYMLVNKYRCDTKDVSTSSVLNVVLPELTHIYALPSNYPFCGTGDPGSIVAVSPIEPNLNSTFDS
jgi:hypothetical protein